MAKIIKTTDFTGIFAISQNSNNTAVLQAFIDKYETNYLYDLLGVELATLFLADITAYNPPATAKYLTLFNPLYVSYNDYDVISPGIKEMLLGFIYFEFVKTQTVKNTLTGNVIAQNEVSTIADWNSTNIYTNYNNSVKTYRAIQIYINKNSSNYTEFNGVMKSYNSWAI